MINKLLFISLLCFVIGCKKNAVITKKIAVDSYEYLTIQSPFNLVLCDDTTHFLEVIGEESIIDKLEAKVENNRLTITDNKNWKALRPSKKITLKVYTKNFKEIFLEGACEVNSFRPLTSEHFGCIFGGVGSIVNLDLNNEVFYFWNNNNGSLKLSGKTDVVKLWFSRLFLVEAKDLKAKAALVYTNSLLDCSVRASEKLEAEIVGDADVYLYGNPPLIVEKENTTGEDPKGKLYIQ